MGWHPARERHGLPLVQWQERTRHPMSEKRRLIRDGFGRRAVGHQFGGRQSASGIETSYIAM